MGGTCDFTCTNTDRVKIENVELNNAFFRVHGHAYSKAITGR